MSQRMAYGYGIVRVVDVYVYRLRYRAALEFLLLRRAMGKAYEGQWRMVGGKIAAGETAWQAARREVVEEAGKEPAAMWVIPSVNAFYEWQHDRVNLIPAFGAQLDAEPELNDEHDAYAWVPLEEAVRRLRWPEQRRLVRLVSEMLSSGVPPELYIHPSSDVGM